MTTLHLRKSISSECFRGLLFIPLALCYFALSPALQAVTPAPDGGYPGANTAEGQDALFSLTSGPWNTALGFQALHGNTTGNSNTAEGYHALFTNTIGSGNTANGGLALFSNTTGSHNTANGVQALYGNTTGASNTADGFQALGGNSTGVNNVADGLEALFHNTTGSYNTATGYQALLSNTTGSFNTANGSSALGSNTTGKLNTANGYQALFGNIIGEQNTATGYAALDRNTSDANTANGYAALAFNTSGFDNTAYGDQALYSNTIGDFNTAIGFQALANITTGLNNVAVGEFAGGNLTADDGQNIDIGQSGVAGDNRTTRIGASQLRAFIAGIYGATASGGIAVYVNSDGQLGTATSSARFKQNIRSMDQASEAILALKPVTFRYKPELDPKGTAQFGLVAEEVEKVNPDLVVRDPDGKPYTVRYEAVNAMLLNEFLKEHKKVEGLEKDLRATIVQQQKEIEALTAGLQRVSAQLELRKTAPQTVANNQ